MRSTKTNERILRNASWSAWRTLGKKTEALVTEVLTSQSTWQLGAAGAAGAVLEHDRHAPGLQRGAHRAADVDVRVAPAPARLVGLGGEAALELGDDPVDGGEVLQRAGGQCAVELGERAAGRERLRALDTGGVEFLAQVGLETADLLAGELWLLSALVLHRAPRLASQAQSAADALDVDAEHAGALAAAAEGGDREASEIAHRGVVAVADHLQELLAQVVELDPLAAGDAVAILLPHFVAERAGLGGAEKEALEHEVEDAAVLGRLGERGGERRAEVGGPSP